MTIVQVTSLFNAHLLSYLTNLFEQVYLTAIMSVTAEFLAILASGLMMTKLGVKISLTACYLASGLSGIIMLTYGL